MKNTKNQITFKEFTLEDVPLYYRWAEEEHVKNVWFLDGYQPKEYILKKIEGNGMEYPFLILANNQPIGFIQYWDVHARDLIEKEKHDYFTGSAPGTYGIDIFIGEKSFLDKGYGTEILLGFTKLLFDKYGAKRIVVDPSTENKRALRCYEKAGFKFAGSGNDRVSGEVAIMELTQDF